MSNATYNGQWAGAMAELAEQVHLEDPTLEAEEGAPLILCALHAGLCVKLT